MGKSWSSCSNQEKTAAILKLDIDCLEEVFDYLPLEDLISVSKTCKRLQQVAGYCFQESYLGTAACSSSKGITRGKNLDVEHFAHLIHKIEIYPEEGFQCFFNARSKFRRLKGIEFRGLKTDDINRLKDISMEKLEVLRMSRCDLGNNFHKIIKRCPRLRRLQIEECKGVHNRFFRKYPSLEYFEFKQATSEPIHSGIAKFLELNPNIHKFTTNEKLFWKNRRKFIAVDVKLDDLAIHMPCSNINKLRLICDLLNRLHRRGFYKKLQLHFDIIWNEETINRLASLNGLVKVYVVICIVPFTALKKLNELYVAYSDDVADLKMLPKNLTNLKRIHFTEASIDSIMLFIRRSVEMNRIKVDCLRSGVYFNQDTGIIDLRALNRERKLLPDAHKIKLYVNEKVYLATKWAMKGNDFELIRLKRHGSFEWHHDFSL